MGHRALHLAAIKALPAGRRRYKVAGVALAAIKTQPAWSAALQAPMLH
jgi:hypothetical protein